MSEIKNFIPSYPDRNDPELIRKFSHLKEFSDLRLGPIEAIPEEPGIPLSHQELQARYFAENTPYRDGILWHGLGTGKCVHPETLIDTSDGIHRIDFLWDSITTSDGAVIFYDGEGFWLRPDRKIFILSYNEKTKFIESRPIKRFYRQLVDELLVQIVLSDGSNITITKAHRLFNGSNWTNDLKERGIVCVPDRTSDQGISLQKRSIKQITFKQYTGWVYDLEIESTHNYIANNILCHNTCTASLIVERFKKTLVDGRPRRRALIIVKNGHLRESFRNEIAKVCTRDIYLPRLSRHEKKKLFGEGAAIELTDEAKRRRLNSAIAQTYEIVTFGELLDLKSLPSEKMIEKGYSDRIIIVDEIHNIRIQPSSKKKPADKLEYSQYDALHRFLHIVKNCRIFLLTATPIWDKVYDIAGLLNLLLPLNEQLPVLNRFVKEFFKDGELIPEKALELKEKMRGRISHLRALISSAERTEVGIKEPWLKWVTVYPSILSDFQESFAEEAKGLLEKDKNDAFLTDARDAANCVFPVIENGRVVDGVYGTKAFQKYAVKTLKKWAANKGGVRKQLAYVSYNVFELDKEVAKILGPIDGPDPYANLRIYATKFATIIEMLKDPKRFDEKAFIYGDSVQGTGGVISLALVMKLYGFHWVKSSDAIPRKGKEITVKNPGSFIVITSEEQTINESAQIRKALEEYNKDDNIYGTRLRIIIGSQTIAQGHTLKATRQGHALMPHWNLPGIDQAMGRIYRAGSFDQLPENERYVNFYRHVSIPSAISDTIDSEDGEVKSISSTDRFSSKLSVDTYIYRIAEEKEHLNSQIYRIMKETAWDCALSYDRNVLVSDEDGSRVCDFTDCNYQCDNYSLTDEDRSIGPQFMKKSQGHIWSYHVQTDEIDSSNFNLLYSDKRVEEYIKKIVALFERYFTLHLDVLLDLLGLSSDRQIVLRALGLIIDRRIIIRNRYGFGNYLKEAGDLYFLDAEGTSTYSNYSLSIYSIFPLVTELSSLSDSVEVIQLEEDKSKIRQFVERPSLKSLSKIFYHTRIILLEKVVELENDSSYRPSHQEYAIIKVIKNSMGKELYFMPDETIIHNLYNSKYTGTGYNVFTKDLKPNGKMRVFENGRWEYVDPDKESRYIDQIRFQVAERIKVGLQDNPYKMYGAIDKSNKFKIIDDREGKAKTGRVCKTIPIESQWAIFHHLKHLPYEDEIADSIKELSDEEIVNLIRLTKKKTWKETPYVRELLQRNIFSTDEIRKIYAMLNMDKDSLCRSLERWFRGDNPEGQVLFSQL